MTEPDHLAATRAVYDATANEYARRVGTEVSTEFEGPVDRAFLAAFVELVGSGGGRVADVGCGPGRVASWLTVHGLEVVGVDVSLAMLNVARAAHPDIGFVEGRLGALPFRDGSLSAAVCWYSIIHTAPGHLPEVFSDLRRVLADGGHLLVAFQAGSGEAEPRTDAHGSGHTLTHFRHHPTEVARSLVEAGLAPHTEGRRDPQLGHESTPQAFIIAATAKPTGLLGRKGLEPGA